MKPDFFKLSNGLSVLYLYTPNDPISACHLFLRQGTSDEDPGMRGQTALMWSLFKKGTQEKSAKQVAEDIESMGAHMGASASHDYSHVSCQSIADFFPQTIALMAECLKSSFFHDTEVEKEKQALISAIQAKKENIFTVASEILNENIFPDHPYGTPPSGNITAIGTLKPEQLTARHGHIVSPEHATLAIASSHPLADIKNTIEGIFDGPWSDQQQNKILPVLNPTPNIQGKNIEESSPFEQAFLMLGTKAPAATSPDYIPLKYLSSLLGGGMSSRLFQSLREKRGLAYDVGTYYATKKHGSQFVNYMGLQASRLEEAEQGMRSELDLIQNKKISEPELNQVRNYMKGSYILDHQTNSQRSYYLGWWETMGLSEEFDRQYVEILDKITNIQILEIAQKYLSQDSIKVVLKPKN